MRFNINTFRQDFAENMELAYEYELHRLRIGEMPKTSVKAFNKDSVSFCHDRVALYLLSENREGISIILEDGNIATFSFDNEKNVITHEDLRLFNDFLASYQII